MQATRVLVLGVVVMVLLLGCAAGPNDSRGTPDQEEHVAGFWHGLWHGIIAPVTLVISLFSEHVNLYDVHNNGGWYSVGFFFGMGIILGGGGRGSAG